MLNFQTLKAEAQLRDGIKQMQDSNDSRLPTEQEKLVTLLSKKDDLLKRIAHTEADIMRKEKELKSRRK